MTCAQHRARAREALSGHWGIAVILGFLAALINGEADLLAVKLDLTQRLMQYGLHLPPVFCFLALGLTVLVGTVAVTFVIIRLTLGGILEVGLAQYHLNLMDDGDGAFTDFFSHFVRFIQGFLMMILRTLAVLAGTVLLVIPGIMLWYGYALAPYILAEDFKCSGIQALKRSRQLMKGHKKELFLLELSFLGWQVLGIVTFGIANLWISPYMTAARTSFYRSLVPVSGAETQEI